MPSPNDAISVVINKYYNSDVYKYLPLPHRHMARAVYMVEKVFPPVLAVYGVKVMQRSGNTQYCSIRAVKFKLRNV